MAARRDAKPSPTTPASPPSEPPYYIATAPLYIGGQFGRAHNPGDRVPAEHVATYGWQDKVRLPDGYTAAPAPVQSSSAPETTTGQATTTGKGEA